MRALAAYRALLANRPLTKLLGGEFVSAIGDWLYIVGILVVIYRETGDPTLLGVFGALRTLPYVVLSIPAGIVADRFDRRMILLVTDLARGACMLGMAILVATNGPVVAIIGLSVLAASFSTFFYPAIGAYLPSLVQDERQLGPANSAWSSLDNVGFIVGPALGGLLVATGGVTFAFLINAATFVVIAGVLWTLPPSRAGAKGSTEQQQPQDQRQPRPAEPGFGRRRLAPALTVGILSIAAGMALLGASTFVVGAMVAIALASIGNLVLDVVTTTIFQRVTPDRIRGRGLGVLMTTSTLAESLGSLLLPVLIATAGPWPALPILGGLMLAAGGVAIVLIGPAATREASPFEETLIRAARLPLFTGVGSSSIERALGRLVEMPVTAGQAIVTEGDTADRFYIIESGTFTVSQVDPAAPDGSRVLRQLGRDDVFGELGLLTGAPRSATVTAETDGVLLALDRRDFLAMVGRTGTLRGRLLGLYEEAEAPG